jgi:hypothetical protein
MRTGEENKMRTMNLLLPEEIEEMMRINESKPTVTTCDPFGG